MTKASTKRKAALVFEDGTRFEGVFAGTSGEAQGEVVIKTDLVGYQEIITDPANAGKIVVMTMPQIGNYGVNVEDIHPDATSPEPVIAGLIVREMCYEPSSFRATDSLPRYLDTAGIPALDEVDIRAITLYLRTKNLEEPGQTAKIVQGEGE